LRLIEVNNLINQVNFTGNNLVLDVGNFNLAGPNRDLRTLDPARDVGDLGNKNITDLIPNVINAIDYSGVRDKINSSSLPSGLKDAVNNLFDKLRAFDNGVKLTFPLLDNPAQSVFKLLVGQDVDFVSFQVQFAALSARQEQSLPVFGPLSLGLTGTINIQDIYLRIAYDTYGLRQFINNPGRPEKIAAGFYFDTSRPLLVMNGSLDARAGVSGAVFEVGVAGGVHAQNVTVRLNDDPLTHKLRLFNGPIPCLFQTTGTIAADISAYVRIGVKIFGAFVGVEKTFDLGSKKLLDLTSGCTMDPNDPNNGELGAVNGNGQLTLYMGNSANLRKLDPAATTEVFTITHADPQPGDPAGTEAVFVSAFGITKRYRGIRQDDLFYGGIYAFNSGNGKNESITVGEGVHANVSFTNNGTGSTQFTYLGDGPTYLLGGGGTNHLTGGSGTNNLFGGSGANTLIGGPGRNYLHGGSGSNLLIGGEGPQARSDLIGGSGPNRLIAGTGDDYLQSAADTTNVLVAGKGRDALLAREGISNQVIWTAGNGVPARLEVNGTLQVVGSDGDDTIDVGRNVTIQVTSPQGSATFQPTRFSGRLAIEGQGGRNRILIHSLPLDDFWHVDNVDVNLAELLNGNHAQSTITVDSSNATNRYRAIDTDTVNLDGTPNSRTALVTRLNVSNPTVRVANIGDDLIVNNFGSSNQLNIKAITGHTVVYGDQGSDRYDVGWVGYPYHPYFLYRLLGLLEIHAGPGTNTLNLHDDDGSLAGFTVTASSVTGTVRGPDGQPVNIGINYDLQSPTAGTLDVHLTTGPSDDTVTVLSTSNRGTTTLHNVGGRDTIQVTPTARNLNPLAGPLVVDGAFGISSSDTLTVNDQDNGVNSAWTVTASSISRQADLPSPAAITYSRVTNLTINAGSGINTFAVQSTAAGCVTTINGGVNGQQQFNIGSASQTLNAIAGPVTLNGQGSQNALNVNDRGATAGKQYQLSSSSVRRVLSAGPPATYDAVINFFGIDALTVNGSNFGNVYTILRTPAGTSVTVNGGLGGDFFDVRANYNSLLGTLALHGQAVASNSVQFYDAPSPGGQTYTLTASTATSGRAGQMPVNFDNMEQLLLSTSSAGGSTVNVLSLGDGMVTNLTDSDRDAVTIGSSSSLAAIRGWAIVGSFGGGRVAVNVDDSVNPDTAPRQVTFASDSLVLQRYA
jgi:hypothetical protein